jgi:hypothetical protein
VENNSASNSIFALLTAFVVLWRKRLTIVFYFLKLVWGIRKVCKLKKEIEMVESGKIGIANLIIAVHAVASLSTGVAALADKGIGADDLPEVQEAGVALFALKDCKFDQLSIEIADLDTEEQLSLATLFQEKFDLPNDKTEVLVENGIKFLLMAISFLLPLLQKTAKPATI